MYRTLLYYLIALVSIAYIFSIFGKFNFTSFDLIISVILVLGVSLGVNKLLSWLYQAPVNTESVYITALILVLIITPRLDYHTVSFLVFAAVVSTASKFVLAIEKKHLFNPAAIAVVISGFALSWYPTWWVSNTLMLPYIVIGGLLLIRRINREELLLAFLSTVAIVSMYFIVVNHRDAYTYFTNIIVHSSLLFLGFVMLTEPMTLPATRNLQIIYAILVGILFVPGVSIGNIFTTPELALVVGNVFSYLVSPKYKLFLKLAKKEQVSPDIYNFTFKLDKPINFRPGQYMEWTLNHENSDSRGVRRFLTIASSPTENNLQLGVKFYPNGSSYKKALLQMKPGDSIIGSQLAGDFVLPSDPNIKCAFIAGGIGVTPFRSMIKYLLDTNQKRNVALFYSDKRPESFIYTDVFNEAKKKLGFNIVYTATYVNTHEKSWNGNIGRITPQLIKNTIPDYAKYRFYISGSQNMVKGMKEMLSNMNIKQENIITDYFPGLN